MGVDVPTNIPNNPREEILLHVPEILMFKERMLPTGIQTVPVNWRLKLHLAIISSMGCWTIR